MPEPRGPYPSDLSDAEWSLLEPLLESSERRGRPPKWPARLVADAVFYLLRSGCAWRMLPREYPTQGRPSTTTSGSGAATGGCAKPTTGFARRCARRKGASGTRAGL
jgi:transposase